jgi:glycosyltransferase involved in cell wall biosynthesis
VDLLAVTPYYAPEGGGLERYAHEILRRLADTHDVEALAFTREDHDSTVHEGVPVRRQKPRFVLGNAPVDPAFPGAVTERIQARDPDVVLAHTPVPFPAESAYLAARRQEIPFVLTFHAGQLAGSSPVLDLAARVHRHTVQRLVLAGSAELIAVSPTVRDRALARHRDEVTLVPPGVDAEAFTPGPDGDRPEILFVGPLSSTYAWKGLDTLWEAFQQVRDENPEARLTLVGEGDRLPAFRERARRLDGALHLPGRVSDEQLVDHLRSARVLALPSTSPAESFGMVMAEANACGTPVVASRVGGIPSFVDHEHNGLLAEPGDPADLAAQLLRVLADPELARRMGKRGRQRVLADHDWDRLARRTERVLERAAATAR